MRFAPNLPVSSSELRLAPGGSPRLCLPPPRPPSPACLLDSVLVRILQLLLERPWRKLEHQGILSHSAIMRGRFLGPNGSWACAGWFLPTYLLNCYFRQMKHRWGKEAAVSAFLWGCHGINRCCCCYRVNAQTPSPQTKPSGYFHHNIDGITARLLKQTK